MIRRITSVALLAALLAWAVLAFMGYAKLPVNAAFTMGVLLLLLILTVSRPGSRKDVPTAEEERVQPQIDSKPDPIPSSSIRPKAVTEEYNTLAGWPSRRTDRPGPPPPKPTAPTAPHHAAALAPHPAAPPAAGPTRPPEPPKAPPEKPAPRYLLPPTSLLFVPEAAHPEPDELVLGRGALLEATLERCGLEGQVADFTSEDDVTHYEVKCKQPLESSTRTLLKAELTLALAAEQVRLEMPPTPDGTALRVTVPNRIRPVVSLRNVLESTDFKESTSRLTVGLGGDPTGPPVVGNLAQMPLLLVEGGSGTHAVGCLHTLLCSLLFKARPDEVKFLLIDPQGKLSLYGDLPHLIAPVLTDMGRAAKSLREAVAEVEERSRRFASLGVRDLKQYNHVIANYPGPNPQVTSQSLPYVIICVAELRSLMEAHPREVEELICRLAPNAGACGLHLIVATDTPSDEAVVTGWMRANMPARITLAPAFAGRTVMRFQPSGLVEPILAQGAVVDEASIRALVKHCQKQPPVVR